MPNCWTENWQNVNLLVKKRLKMKGSFRLSCPGKHLAFCDKHVETVWACIFIVNIMWTVCWDSLEFKQDANCILLP